MPQRERKRREKCTVKGATSASPTPMLPLLRILDPNIIPRKNIRLARTGPANAVTVEDRISAVAESAAEIVAAAAAGAGAAAAVLADDHAADALREVPEAAISLLRSTPLLKAAISLVKIRAETRIAARILAASSRAARNIAGLTIAARKLLQRPLQLPSIRPKSQFFSPASRLRNIATNLPYSRLPCLPWPSRYIPSRSPNPHKSRRAPLPARWPPRPPDQMRRVVLRAEFLAGCLPKLEMKPLRRRIRPERTLVQRSPPHPSQRKRLLKPMSRNLHKLKLLSPKKKPQLSRLV